jgi:hypothetical protein
MVGGKKTGKQINIIVKNVGIDLASTASETRSCPSENRTHAVNLERTFQDLN